MSTHNGPNIVKNGLVLHLDAGNSKSYPGSGTAWTDLSGSGNSATLVNGPSYSSSNGGGIQLDGTNDYCSVENSSSINISGNSITLDIVYKNNDLANSSHGDGLIVKDYPGQNNAQYELLLVTNNSNNYAFFRCNGIGFYSPQTIAMNIQSIYHVCCVMDNLFMKIYVNGVLDGSGIQKSSGSIISTSGLLYFGSRKYIPGPDSTQNGTIYSSKIYNRALSESEVKQNFNALRGRYGI